MRNLRTTVLGTLLGALCLAAPVHAHGSVPPLPASLLGAKKQAPKRAKTKAAPEEREPWHFERLGVAVGALRDNGRMQGEQWIHTSRLDESFNFDRSGPVFSVWGMGQILPNLWLGPEVRVMGPYTTDNFDFGLLQELGGRVEWSLNFFEKFDFVLGGRLALAVLIPGGDFANEIQRLQREGAGVWNIPRVGWTLGFSGGIRRQMAERFWLRLDIAPQLGRVYLFSSSNYVEQYRVRKYWTSEFTRLELGLSAEFAL
ncbi:MAG TPA: hypothetical protein VK013_07805 [Myxococcaceae bacterium]|nr:hypothetical protein [Myxococcaceae bacterium]